MYFQPKNFPDNAEARLQSTQRYSQARSDGGYVSEDFGGIVGSLRRIVHPESILRGAEDNPEKIRRFEGEVAFMKKAWAAELAADRFCSHT